MRERLLITCLIMLFGFPLSATAADRHAGYYYPPPSSIEDMDSKALRMTQADRRMRIGFVIGLVDQLLSRPYAPTEFIFVKGAQAEKLIIVATEPGRLSTIYRVRGYLATMTSVARDTSVFSQTQMNDVYSFIDLLKIVGFKRITLSDGESFTHQINVK